MGPIPCRQKLPSVCKATLHLLSQGFHVRTKSFTARTWVDSPHSGSSKQGQGCSDGDPDVPPSIKVHLLLQAYKDELLITHPNRDEYDRHVGHRWTMQKLMGVNRQQEKPTYVGELNTSGTAGLSLEAKLWVQFAANTLLALLSVVPISTACRIHTNEISAHKVK